MNINKAIQTIRNNVDCPYVRSYIEALPDVIEEDGTHGLVVQMSYILANLINWKGHEAKEVKAFIKKWIKSKKSS